MHRSGLRDTWFWACAVHSMLLYVIIERATICLSVALRVGAQQHQKVNVSAPRKPPCSLASLLPGPDVTAFSTGSLPVGELTRNIATPGRD